MYAGYSSVRVVQFGACEMEQEALVGQLMPPASSTMPLLSSVALCAYRLVLRTMRSKFPTVKVAVPETLARGRGNRRTSAARAVINPVALTVAMAGFDEAHVLEAVRSVAE